MTDLLKGAQAAIDRKPTRDELRAVQDAFAEPATADDLAFGRVGGIGDPLAHAIAERPLTLTEFRDWCKNARLAIQVHEAGESPVLDLLHLGENGISAAKRLAAIALQYLSEQGGVSLASDLAASAQAVDELSDVLPILTRIEDWHDASEENSASVPQWDENTEARNRWIYEQAIAGKTLKEQKQGLAQLVVENGWDPIDSIQGIANVPRRYVLHHPELPLPPKRKAGRKPKR